MGQLESISVGTINGWNWTEMADESWRYSVDQEISGDIDIGSVTATEVVILTEAAGTVTPSQWLQKSGGVLSGRVSLADVSIQGDLDITHHFINDVDLRHVLTRINHDVGGVKTLQKLVVHEDILANSFNGVSIVLIILKARILIKGNVLNSTAQFRGMVRYFSSEKWRH